MVVSTHSVMPRTEAGSQRSGTGHMSPLNLEESLEISINYMQIYFPKTGISFPHVSIQRKIRDEATNFESGYS